MLEPEAKIVEMDLWVLIQLQRLPIVDRGSFREAPVLVRNPVTRSRPSLSKLVRDQWAVRINLSLSNPHSQVRVEFFPVFHDPEHAEAWSAYGGDKLERSVPESFLHEMYALAFADERREQVRNRVYDVGPRLSLFDAPGQIARASNQRNQA